MPKRALPLIPVTLLLAACALQPDMGTPSMHAAASPAPAVALAPLPQGGGAGSGSSPCLAGAKIQLAVNPTSIVFGQSGRLSWSVRPPEGCGAPQVRLNGEAVATSGARIVMPSSSTTFVLVAIETLLGQVVQTSASAQVDVGYRTGVLIDGSTPDPVGALVGALGSSNCTQASDKCVQLVEFYVDLDLTGLFEIEIRSFRLLRAHPACARGPRSLGPRIFVTDHRGSKPLFVITGDNVGFSGFRLEGPTGGIAMSSDIEERGMLISPPAGEDNTTQTAPPIQHIEISNMEIFYWSGAGIEVSDNVDKLTQRGRLLNTHEGAVHIHDNFIHHNRHGPGEGYGVAVSHGAYALIERNVFDENRHGITGSVSKNPNAPDYTGYTARDDVILSGGGLHCKIANQIPRYAGGVLGFVLGGLTGGLLGTGGIFILQELDGDLAVLCYHTQQVDMHGDQNEWYSNTNWECGTAGETITIQRNTILYTNGLAINVRGNPADKAVVDGDVFKHGSRSDAISQNGWWGYGDNITKPIDVRNNNVYNADPMAQLGSCDFFGDGLEDQFMATGVTWWALSPVTHQWRYLNTMRERLPEVRLGKFDGDAVCDVALGRGNPRLPVPPRTYSKSGTGPWEDFIGTTHK